MRTPTGGTAAVALAASGAGAVGGSVAVAEVGAHAVMVEARGRPLRGMPRVVDVTLPFDIGRGVDDLIVTGVVELDCSEGACVRRGRGGAACAERRQIGPRTTRAWWCARGAR